MSNTTMKMSSVTDYILKLEKLNEESRTKIEQLKKMLTKESEDKVDALNELNDMKCKSLYHKTAYPFEDEKRSTINEGLVDFLNEFANEASDFYKEAAYRRAAGIVKNLSYEVESGQSLLNIHGIGQSIASKIDEYIEDEDSDYTESDESIASNDDGDSFVSDITDHDVDTD